MKPPDLSTPEGQASALEYEKSVYRIQRQARREVVAEEREATRSKAPLVFDGQEDLRPVEYLVDGVIPAEGAGELFGESDVGKTFVAVSLGVHVAAATPWLGHRVRGGTVLFFEAEGGRAFALRKHAAKGAAKLDERELPFVTVYEPLAFGPDTDVAVAVERAASVRAAVQERKLPPIRLVVADTLAQNMAGDADNNAEMQAFLRVFRAFIKALSDEPVFGLLIHHPGHTEKQRGRGAYALPADLDLIMHLEGSPEALTLSCRRMRDGAPFGSIPLRLEQRIVTVAGEPLRDSRGRDQTSLVLLARDVSREERGADRDVVRDAVLEALPEHPSKVGVQAELVPKVGAILGRSVTKDTVSRLLYGLERDGLAESGPGRQAGSRAWGRAKPREPEPEDM